MNLDITKFPASEVPQISEKARKIAHLEDLGGYG
jgi:hypothetical protein